MFLPVKQLLSFTFLTLVFLHLQIQHSGQSGQSLQELKKIYRSSVSDTAKVALLFQMGRHFRDGPSDSLLFYYGKVLELIRDELAQLDQNPAENSELIEQFR